MSVLNREKLLSRKPKTLTVELPDGDSIIVRRMSALDWERVKESDPEDQDIPRQLAMIMCDEEGKRLFDPDNPDDVKLCGEAVALEEATPILKAAGKITASESGKDEQAKKSEASPNTDLVTA